jgi:hypothetical protein
MSFVRQFRGNFCAVLAIAIRPRRSSSVHKHSLIATDHLRRIAALSVDLNMLYVAERASGYPAAQEFPDSVQDAVRFENACASYPPG